jgi:hypothetical protein
MVIGEVLRFRHRGIRGTQRFVGAPKCSIYRLIDWLSVIGYRLFAQRGSGYTSVKPAASLG